MKSLTLLRHGKSSWKSTAESDRFRPLSKRGKRDAPVIGGRITTKGIRPSLILSSPATRAWSTAKIVADTIKYPKEFLQRDDRLYMASVSSIIDVIEDQDNGFNNIMIVAHNPGLTAFANFLVPDITPNLPTCGVVSVTMKSDEWELRTSPDATLVLYDYPKRAVD